MPTARYFWERSYMHIWFKLNIFDVHTHTHTHTRTEIHGKKSFCFFSSILSHQILYYCQYYAIEHLDHPIYCKPKIQFNAQSSCVHLALNILLCQNFFNEPFDDWVFRKQATSYVLPSGKFNRTSVCTQFCIFFQFYCQKFNLEIVDTQCPSIRST
jgi:hypothetical protein